jgi:hypothetical protein
LGNKGENCFGLTHEKTGGAIRPPTDAEAFQVFDQITLYLLEPRHREKSPVRRQVDSFEELGEKMG